VGLYLLVTAGKVEGARLLELYALHLPPKYPICRLDDTDLQLESPNLNINIMMALLPIEAIYS